MAVTSEQLQQRMQQLQPDKKVCHKIPFKTRQEARNAIKEANLHVKKKLQYEYLCKDCGFWHMTSRDKVSDRNFKRYKIANGIFPAT